jgi:putative transposase
MSHTPLNPSDDKVRLKMEAIERLTEPCSRREFVLRKRDAAERLGVSVRSIERLLRRWNEEGFSALSTAERSDKGKHRISQRLVDLAIKTYRDGNQDGRRMSRSAVAEEVRAHAVHRGLKVPSHQTVYNILKPIISKEREVVDSPAWSLTDISIKTPDERTIELTITLQKGNDEEVWEEEIGVPEPIPDVEVWNLEEMEKDWW